MASIESDGTSIEIDGTATRSEGTAIQSDVAAVQIRGAAMGSELMRRGSVDHAAGRPDPRLETLRTFLVSNSLLLGRAGSLRRTSCWRLRKSAG